LLLEAVTALARAFPLEVGYRVSDALSAAHRALSPARRSAVRENLDLLCGGSAPPEAERDVFRNFGRFVFEFLRGPEVPELDVHFEGWPLLERARALGRGVILVTVHTGNWELVGARMARRGVPVHAVADTQLNASWATRLRERQRESGIRVLAPGFATWRALPRLLADNESLVLLVDGSVYRSAKRVRFGGGFADWPTGPARLAARTHAALVPAFEHRDADGSFHCRFLEPIVVADDSPAAIRSATDRMADAFAARLSARPGQWMIFRRFYESTPSRFTATAGTPRTAP
jgi:KDO2-lipid IV(A) lauroyltransferase